MKVIHVLKKIEQLDEDIKELRKMEKALQRNKSFSTPIFMMIEKQINILLGDRIKLLELKVENPPEHLAREFDGEKNNEPAKPLRKHDKKSSLKKEVKKTVSLDKKSAKKPVTSSLDDDIPMMTQDMIDSKFNNMKKQSDSKPEKKEASSKNLLIPKKSIENAPFEDDEHKEDDKDVKLLDIALERGTLNKDVIDKEKKRVRFFRDNFPGGEY